MAGLEIVVRPVVLPNIRPAPARSLPPQDDPESGFCVIKGQGGHHVDLTYSHTISWSKSKPTETERRVDEVRVYQQEDDGTVNKENFVDLEVANRITMDEGRGYTDLRQEGGFEGEFEPGINYKAGPVIPVAELKTYYYDRQTEKDNIEIMKVDQIKVAGES